MNPLRAVLFTQLLALGAASCRPQPVVREPDQARDERAVCPSEIAPSSPCATAGLQCSQPFSQCAPMPTVTDPDAVPVPPRCSGHERQCTCARADDQTALVWLCRSVLTHPAGPQPPPELSA
jgi:hypothetical protein